MRNLQSHQRPTWYSQFHISYSQGNSVSDIKSIIAFGADVATGDYDRRTPLHIAAAEGKADMVQYNQYD